MNRYEMEVYLRNRGLRAVEFPRCDWTQKRIAPPENSTIFIRCKKDYKYYYAVTDDKIILYWEISHKNCPGKITKRMIGGLLLRNLYLLMSSDGQSEVYSLVDNLSNYEFGEGVK